MSPLRCVRVVHSSDPPSTPSRPESQRLPTSASSASKLRVDFEAAGFASATPSYGPAGRTKRCNFGRFRAHVGLSSGPMLVECGRTWANSGAEILVDSGAHVGSKSVDAGLMLGRIRAVSDQTWTGSGKRRLVEFGRLRSMIDGVGPKCGQPRADIGQDWSGPKSVDQKLVTRLRIGRCLSTMVSPPRGVSRHVVAV